MRVGVEVGGTFTDLVAVGAAFLGFFPALQSLASGASPRT